MYSAFGDLDDGELNIPYQNWFVSMGGGVVVFMNSSELLHGVLPHTGTRRSIVLYGKDWPVNKLLTLYVPLNSVKI